MRSTLLTNKPYHNYFEHFTDVSFTANVKVLVWILDIDTPLEHVQI